MKHSKLQRLTFYTYIQSILNNKYIDKLLDKLKKNVSHPQRNYILDLASRVSRNITEKEARFIVLLYCLHTAKPKDGYSDMIVKSMIEESDIKLSEEEIVVINNKLKGILNEMNLPELKLDRTTAQNIAHYSPEFKKKYGRYIED